jgi:hypothetical protein
MGSEDRAVKPNRSSGPNTMGMYCTLTQITEDELRQIRSDPESVSSVLKREGATSPPPTSRSARSGSSDVPSSPTPTIRLVSLEKMWQGLHFLLTGEPWGGTPPLSLALLGGDPIDEQEDGSSLVLGPSDVKAVATALSALTREGLYRRFVPEKFAAADIYPSVWDEDREDLFSEFMHYFDQLVAFYQDAAKCGSAVLIDIG